MNNKLIEILTPSIELKPQPAGLKSSGEILKNIKACIFDIYGTLLISGSGDVGTAIEAGSTESFSIALRNCGINTIPEAVLLSIKDEFFGLIKETHLRMKDRGIRFPEIDIVEIWTKIISSQKIVLITPQIKGLDPQIIAAAYESTVNPVYPMPGMLEVLKSLKSRGVRLGIVSNAQFYTPLIMNSLLPGGIETFGFDESLILFSYLEKRSKPDLELFEKLSKRLKARGIKAEETIYIGNDMLKDIMPSSVCGYKTALFAGDKRSLRLREEDDACRNIKPDVIVSKLTDLLNYIQEG